MSHTQQTDNNGGWQGRERRASNKERNVVKSKDRDMVDRQDWAHGKGDSSGRWYSEVEKGSASEWKHERSCCHPSLMLLIRYWPAVCLLAPYQCLTLSDPTLIDCTTALMLCVFFFLNVSSNANRLYSHFGCLSVPLCERSFAGYEWVVSSMSHIGSDILEAYPLFRLIYRMLSVLALCALGTQSVVTKGSAFKHVARWLHCTWFAIVLLELFCKNKTKVDLKRTSLSADIYF